MGELSELVLCAGLSSIYSPPFYLVHVLMDEGSPCNVSA